MRPLGLSGSGVTAAENVSLIVSKYANNMFKDIYNFSMR